MSIRRTSNLADESSGRAWASWPVVVIEAGPSVLCTRWIGAPRPGAWEVCACRSQCGETGASMPARFAAARTIRATCRAGSAPPCLRLTKTGAADGQVLPELGREQVARVLRPVPKTERCLACPDPPAWPGSAGRPPR